LASIIAVPMYPLKVQQQIQMSFRDLKVCWSWCCWALTS